MKKFIQLTILVMGFICVLSICSTANAATGSFSISSSSKSVQVNKSTSFSITAKNCAGKFIISSSNSEVASVSTGSVWIDSGSSSITIKGKKAGTATITIKADDVTDTSENPVMGTKRVKVTVKAKSSSGSNSSGGSSGSSSSKSSDATLKMLGVNPSKYDFSGFSKNKTTYNVKVPSDVNSLSVYATTSSSKAKYSVSGNTNLKGGTNLIKVTVTAEDGTKKTYTIRVTKEVDEEEVTPNKIDEEDENEGKEENQENSGIGLSSLEISGYELNQEFNTNVYNYYVVIGNLKFSSTDELKELVKAATNFEDAKTEISVNEGTEDDDFVYEVLITVLDAEKEYATYSIRFVETEEEIPEAPEAVEYPEDEEAKARLEEKDKDLIFGLDRETVEKGILVGSIALPVLIAIILGVIAYDKSKKLRRYEAKYNEDFDDEDDYNNETDSLEDSVSSPDNQNVEENENSENVNNENSENDYNDDIDRSKYEPRYRNPRGGDRRSGRHF